MRFSGFEPKGRLKQQIRFRRPFFQQVATAIRQKQPTSLYELKLSNQP